MWFKTPQSKRSGKDIAVKVRLENLPKEKNFVEEVKGKLLLCRPRG